MKRSILLMGLLLVLLSHAFSQSFLYNYLRADYSILEQIQIRFSWCFEEMASDHNFLESTDLSLSLVNDYSKKGRYYLSLNPIPASMGLLIEKRIKFLSVLLLLPQRLGNWKIQLPFSWESALYFGFNTDYFYYDKLRIYNEFTIGFKQEIKRIKLSANYNWPISKAYLKDKSSFFSIAIGYVLNNEHGG